MGLVTSVDNLVRSTKYSGLKPNQGEQLRSGFNEAFENAKYGQTESMDGIFEEAASRYGLSVSLLKAVAKTESDFNPKAVSHAGAMGVMQLMPGTAKSLGVNDPFNARENIMGGAKYLRENLDRFGGNVRYALAAYNAGPNSVTKYGGIPPYSETQNYVKKVTSYMGGESLYANKNVRTGSDFAGMNSSIYSSTPSYASLNAGMGLNLGTGLGTESGLDTGTGLYANMLTGLLSSVSVEESGDGSEGTITMDKASFANLLQILRIQMMMNVSKDVGSITI